MEYSVYGFYIWPRDSIILYLDTVELASENYKGVTRGPKGAE